MHVSGIERVLEGRQLVEHATKAPYIALVVVRFVQAYLRRKIVRCAHLCLGLLVGIVQHSRDAEIPDLR